MGPRFFCCLSSVLVANLAAGLAQADPLAPVSCLIEAYETVQLAPPEAGIVSEILVDRGDMVAEGDVVARIDARKESIALQLAKARAEDQSEILSLEAKLDYLTLLAERRATLVERNAGSDFDAKEAAMERDVAIRDLERARVALVIAGLDMAQASAALEQKTVTSPIAGIVTERQANAGEYRNGESQIATIARIDLLRVEAFAPIEDYPFLKVGQQVEVTPEPPLDQTRRATIRVIDRVFDASTATFGLRMDLENPDLSLPAGLRCTLSFPQILAQP
jgi:RND family efflux transporter MFP subunit